MLLKSEFRTLISPHHSVFKCTSSGPHVDFTWVTKCRHAPLCLLAAIIWKSLISLLLIISLSHWVWTFWLCSLCRFWCHVFWFLNGSCPGFSGAYGTWQQPRSAAISEKASQQRDRLGFRRLHMRWHTLQFCGSSCCGPCLCWKTYLCSERWRKSKV